MSNKDNDSEYVPIEPAVKFFEDAYTAAGINFKDTVDISVEAREEQWQRIPLFKDEMMAIATAASQSGLDKDATSHWIAAYTQPSYEIYELEESLSAKTKFGDAADERNYFNHVQERHARIQARHELAVGGFFNGKKEYTPNFPETFQARVDHWSQSMRENAAHVTARTNARPFGL